MKNVKEQGADAVLIGETFMRSDNIKETMKTVTELPMIQNQIKEQSLKVKCAAAQKRRYAYAMK